MISGILALLLQGTPVTAAPCDSVGPWPTKKWLVAEPGSVGLDPDSLQAVVTRARKIPGVTSIMVVRHGQIALEEYFHGGSRSQAVPVASITKSVTSMLVGIALDRGLIDSLDQPLIQLLPQLAPPRGRALSITVRQLLTMTSGLSEEWYLEKPLMLRVMTSPGSTFRYSNEAVQFLIRAISETSGENVLKFSSATLWKPLDIDIDQSRWPRFEPNGNGDGAGGLRLTTRELGKLGLLALRGGCWDGKQLVPAAYMNAAMRKQVDGGIPKPDGRGYGFLWWITPAGVPYMAGYGGQYVVVFTDLDIVAIVTARIDAPDPDENGQFRLISEGVTGAVQH